MVEQDCIFCRIAKGEIPAKTLYTDEQCVAFRDTNPQAPVHILIIPRAHIESLSVVVQSDEAMLGRLIRVAAQVAHDQGLAESGYRTVINSGADAGQSVLHLHVHVLGGRPLSWPPG